ncbi:MAG TPA: serine hydrolase domain-containing protein, partial [Sphingomicrobium sp.]|nr:serine hydrolase domain-containing protein [Sphingomicrobium sp.]
MRSFLLLPSLALAGCATVQQTNLRIGTEVGVAFDAGRETGSFADGLADPSSGRRVTIDDPVRVASVSKMITAIGVMRLVDQGELDLGSDVSRWLGWPLRNPNFPGRPITLTMLLSHTASIREYDDDYVIPLGASLRDVMSDGRNWDRQHGPGDYFSYVNLNYPIIASIMEKVTGERFDVWMRANVLAPMKLDACFNWPTCSDDAVAHAVELDSPEGTAVKDNLHGHRPDCPVFVKDPASCDLGLWRPGENGALFAPQGGLRISARGLGRVGRMLLNGGTLEGVRILSPAAVDTLLRQVWRFDGKNGQTDGGFYCSAGNGTHQIPNREPGCADDMGSGGALLVGHAGDAYNMKSGIWIDRTRRRGIAYFVTGVPDPAPKAPESAYTLAEVHAFRRTYALL